MKNTVSPILVAVSVLIVLITIQLIYWRRLSPMNEAMSESTRTELQQLYGKSPGKGSGGGRGGGGGDGGRSVIKPRGRGSLVVATLAGNIIRGYQDGPASEARFNGPTAVAVSAAGDVYVTDSRNHVIRRISPQGIVSTYAGAPQLNGFGGYADGPTSRARFSAPVGLTLLPDGSLLVADTGNHRIRKVSPKGVVSTLAGSDTPKDTFGQPLGGYRDGPVAQAQFRYPAGIAADINGALYIADPGNHCVRRLANGMVSTIPTEGGKMESPTFVLVDPELGLCVGDSGKRMAGPNGDLWVGPAQGPLRVWSFSPPKKFGFPAGMAVTHVKHATGVEGRYRFLLDATLHCLYQIKNHAVGLEVGEQTTPNYVDGPGYDARFATPAGMAAGPGGLLYIADFDNNCIRTVTIRRPPHAYLPPRRTW